MELEEINKELFLMGKIFQKHGYGEDGSMEIMHNLVSKIEKYLFSFNLHSIYEYENNKYEDIKLICVFSKEKYDETMDMAWFYEGKALLFRFCRYSSEKQHHESR